MNSGESELRKTHVRDTLLRAFEASAKDDWFIVLSALQEAEIIARLIWRDEQQNSIRTIEPLSDHVRGTTELPADHFAPVDSTNRLTE